MHPRFRGRAWHRRLAHLLVGVPALLLPGTLRAQGPAPEPAIAELRIGRLAGRTVELWRRGDEALVPLDDFLGLAEFHARPVEGAIEVTIPRHADPLRLRAGDPEIPVPTRGPVPVPPGALLELDGRLAASTRLLEALFGIRFQVDWGELRVTVVDASTLPVADRLRREAARAALATAPDAAAPVPALTPAGDRFEGVVADWSATMPGIGADLAGSLALGAGLGRSSLEVVMQAIPEATGHRLEADATWTRVWHDQPWLTQLRVGDLPLPGPRPRQARGVMITNAPYLRPARVGTVAFAGDLGPGWLVESYRDGALVAFDSVDAFGRYAFEVPVQYGENPLDFVAYGPDGEVRPFSRTVRMSGGQVADQEMQYGIGLGTCRRLACDLTANLDARYGLSARMTVATGFEAAWGDSVGLPVLPYAALVGSPVNGIGVELEYVAGGFLRTALQVEPTTRWLVQAEAGWFDEARSPVLPTGGLRDQQAVRALYRPHGLRSQSYIDAQLQRTATPFGTRTNARLGGSVTAPAGRVLPYVRYQSEIQDEATWFAGTDLYLLPRAAFGPVLGRIWARTRLEFETRGSPSEANAALVSPLGRSGANVEAGVRWRAGVGTRATLQVSAVMPWARAAMTASAGRTGSAVYQALSGSAVWDRQGGVVRTAPGPSLQRAGLSGVVFLDTNANGQQDGDEPGMPGVRLLAGGRLATTDSLGGYHLWDLPAFTTAEVRVDTLSLRDPLWVPDLPAFRVLPGADGYREVPVAMVPAGVLEGRVRWEPTAGRTAGLALRLVDRDAGTTQAIQTFQDGSFYLMGVRPGRYRLEVERAVLQRLEGTSEPVELVITAEDALRGVPSVDVVLRPLP